VNFGCKSFYAGTFLMIFLMMLMIGVTSEVSLLASLTRAVMAAGLFTILTWGVGKLISIYVFPPEQIDDSQLENEDLGTNLDLTVTDQPDDSDHTDIDPSAVQPGTPDEFTPISARQIDPQVNKIINSDPRKAAEIVRKMGFEEEE